LVSNGQAIFNLVEETYRVETSCNNLHEIDIPRITLKLMKNVDIKWTKK
jgi:hypothetical protein